MLLGLAALLGVAAATLPAVAVSETSPSIVAENHAGVKETHSWAPATASVGENGVVTFSNPTNVIHGVEWVADPATPGCSAGVPVGTGPSHSGTNWSGTCTFTKPGVYTFYCTVHGPEMTGTITVSANGKVTSTMSTPAGTPGAPPTGTTTTPTTASPVLAPQTPASPLAGSASAAFKLAAIERGTSVHGSLAISAAGAGGHLEIELLARRAALAGAAHAAPVTVGRSLRSALRAGQLVFSVALDRQARRALQRAHHLALTVRIELTPAQGATVTVDRSVLLRS